MAEILLSFGDVVEPIKGATKVYKMVVTHLDENTAEMGLIEHSDTAGDYFAQIGSHPYHHISRVIDHWDLPTVLDRFMIGCKVMTGSIPDKATIEAVEEEFSKSSQEPSKRLFIG